MQTETQHDEARKGSNDFKMNSSSKRRKVFGHNDFALCCNGPVPGFVNLIVSGCKAESPVL
eukprot:6481049-Amphidinium_carterae.1